MTRGWLAPLLLAGASAAPAQPSTAVHAELLDCERGVELVSQGAGLAQVLDRLSRTLGFSMRYWAAEDPPIRIDTRQSALDLMRELSTHANMIVRYQADPRCPGQLKIESVWVVPRGSPGTTLARSPPPPAAPAAPSPAAPPQPPKMERAEQEYLRAHGMLPPADRPHKD